MRRIWSIACYCHQRTNRVLPFEGHLPCAKAVKDAAKAEQVATMIDLFAAGLLRSHVRRCSDDGPALCQVGIFACRSRQSEVENLHPPSLALQPDVRWLNVSVNESFL